MSFRIGGHVMCVLDMRRCVNLCGGCKIWRDFSVSPACARSGKMRQFCVQCMLDLNETSSLLGVCSQPGRVKMPGEISEQFLCLLWKWNGQLERGCATDHQAACALEHILQRWTKGPKVWDMSTFSDSWMCVFCPQFCAWRGERHSHSCGSRHTMLPQRFFDQMFWSISGYWTHRGKIAREIRRVSHSSSFSSELWLTSIIIDDPVIDLL